MVTTAVADAIGDSRYLEFDPIGEVELKGFPRPVELFVGPRRAARPRRTASTDGSAARPRRNPRVRAVRSPTWSAR